ncbi:MAG TPA: RAMP superfamily CRISPR-associated protein [Pirellulaceae bacterium]|nr:RAMP superfamily CRISPR-associated protein [Pirellulaceae bacterium]
MTIRLLTPLFGGGVIAGQPDPRLPIRGSSIRGQLQFWWRATVGASFPTWREMRKRHGEVWGQAAADKDDRSKAQNRASPIVLSLSELKFDPAVPAAIYSWNPSARGGQGGYRLDWHEWFHRHAPLQYALFPFQGEKPAENRSGLRPKKEPASFFPAGSFQLHLRFPAELERDVDNALTAWIRFGGIGSRGCGSLQSSDILFGSADPLAGLAITDRPAPADWPTLSSDVLLGPSRPAIESWSEAIAVLRDLRQKTGLARDVGARNTAGRSRFPEPDTIRRLTKQSSPGHRPRPELPHGYFPRAALGLPIIFHFKDEKKGDPKESTLLPIARAGGEPAERMASPVIAKAIAVDADRAVAALVRLQAPAPAQLSLRSKQLNPEPRFDSSGALLVPPYTNSPLADYSPTGSAIDALFRYAERDCGFRRPNR